jgi:hypothetical protein
LGREQLSRNILGKELSHNFGRVFQQAAFCVQKIKKFTLIRIFFLEINYIGFA